MMKKAILSLSVAAILLTSSCGSDDSTAAVVNELLFDGTSLEGASGIVVDIGATDDHYTQLFAISDGDMNYNGSTGSFQFQTSSKFFLSLGAASLGNSQFSTGTFEYRQLASSVPDVSHFYSGTFVDIDNSQTLSVTGGTITISGSSPNYTLQFDLTLTGGKKLTGAYVGTFETL